MNLAEKEANQEIASIENQIVVIRETALSEAQKCMNRFDCRSTKETGGAKHQAIDSSERVIKLLKESQEFAKDYLPPKY